MEGDKGMMGTDGMTRIGDEVLGRQVQSAPPHLPTWRSYGCHTDFPSSLRIVLINIRFIENKTLLIHDVILNGDYDLAGITETWMEEVNEVNLALTCPPGFGIRHLPCTRTGR